MSEIFGIVLAVLGLFTICTVSAWIEFLLSSRKDPLAGLIPPALLSLLVYSSFFIVYITSESIKISFLIFALLNLPLIITLIIYLYIRRKSYLAKLELYRKQNKKPAKGHSIAPKTKDRISSFSDDDSKIPIDTQKDVLTRLLSGKSAESVSTLLRYSIEDVESLMQSFDKYCYEQDEKESGVLYTLSDKQHELFIQLLITSSPRALGCGEGLLWTNRSLRTLISDTVGVNISLESVDSFLSDAGLMISPKLTVAERLSDQYFKKWSEEEFEKIRMRALEEVKNIYFCYTVNVNKGKKGRKFSMLAAVSCDKRVAFGLYKGDGGHKDFLDKLSQENGDSLLVIADGDENFAKFSSVKSAAEIIPTVPYSNAE